MLTPYLTRSALHTTKKSTGFCITCGKIATTEAFFKLEGATIIKDIVTTACQVHITIDTKKQNLVEEKRERLSKG